MADTTELIPKAARALSELVPDWSLTAFHRANSLLPHGIHMRQVYT
jgi:hypothetical protein